DPLPEIELEAPVFGPVPRVPERNERIVAQEGPSPSLDDERHDDEDDDGRQPPAGERRSSGGIGHGSAPAMVRGDGTRGLASLHRRHAWSPLGTSRRVGQHGAPMSTTPRGRTPRRQSSVSRWRAFARLVVMVVLGCGILRPVHAATSDEIPPELRPWSAWVLADAPDAVCALVDETRTCVWPGSLDLRLHAHGR